jgi:hypothetical protein
VIDGGNVNVNLCPLSFSDVANQIAVFDKIEADIRVITPEWEYKVFDTKKNWQDA